MEKIKLEELKIEAREAGENDTYSEDKLVESAQLWIDEQESIDETTEEENDALIEAYRQGFFGERLPQSVIESLAGISNEISWDNWEVEEVDGERNSESTGDHWKVCEVLHCKLEHIRELIDELDTLPRYQDGDEHEENRDTLDQLQSLLRALKKFEPSDF